MTKAEFAKKDTPKKKYKVVSENGLFKNGVQYDKGSVLTVGDELPQSAVAAFLEAGDIEEAS